MRFLLFAKILLCFFINYFSFLYFIKYKYENIDKEKLYTLLTERSGSIQQKMFCFRVQMIGSFNDHWLGWHG